MGKQKSKQVQRQNKQQAYDFPENELEISLRRAFVEGERPGRAADYIVVDGETTRNQFLTEGVRYGLAKGLIVHDKKASEAESDSQYTALCYRLTEKGKKHFGIAA